MKTSVIPSEHEAVLPGKLYTEYASSKTIQANHIFRMKSVVEATSEQRTRMGKPVKYQT